MVSTESRPFRTPRAVLHGLRISFKVFRDFMPLAFGIHKAIGERLPEFDPNDLRIAIKMHKSSPHYLKAISQASTRFNLDGEAAGEVTDEQRLVALDALRKLYGAKAARHKAALKRQEKLNKLVTKYNSS
jgi:ProP effector